MENNEEFIREIYYFMQNKEVIPRSERADEVEKELFDKISQLSEKNIISKKEESDISFLFSQALEANEINGFIAGIHFVKNFYKIFH